MKQKEVTTYFKVTSSPYIEKERLRFMVSIGAKKGEQRIVDRNNVFEDVLDMYRIGEVLGECPIKIKYGGEQAIDDGGVQRDMYSAFWEEAYSKFFDGATNLIPMVHPQIDMKVFRVLGRIISHGYLVSGHLPVRIVLPTLINMILGPTEIPAQVLLNAFVDYISATERESLKKALQFDGTNFPQHMIDTLLEVLSRYGCRTVPTPTNLMSTIEHVAEHEFLTKPAAAISMVNSGIPNAHREFWSSRTLGGLLFIHGELTVTSTKILQLLMLPNASSVNEKRVHSYLTTMISNINKDELRSLLRFITGSSVCSAKDILITFNSLSGLARRPIAHTCDCTLELPTTYVNYDDFYEDFCAILAKVNREFSFQMNAL